MSTHDFQIEQPCDKTANRGRGYKALGVGWYRKTFKADPNWKRFPTGDWGVTTYRLMDVVAKRYDPTRKTTVAMYPARAGGIIKANPDFKIKENIVPPELATVTDVASFNYVWDDYQEYLKHAPDMIIYQSEAVTNELAALTGRNAMSLSSHF